MMNETSNHSLSLVNHKQERDCTEQTMEESEYLLDISNHGTAKVSNGDQKQHDCFLIPLVSQFLHLFSHAPPKRHVFEQVSASDSAEVECRVDSSLQALQLASENCISYHSLDFDFSETSYTSTASSSIDFEFQEENEKDGTDEQKHSYQLSDFERHSILGAGQFGQVWLVSEKKTLKKTAYALKVHSKYDLILQGEVNTIIQEKETMKKLRHHPFIVQLHASFQDQHLVYMLQEFCQGGELFSVMHNSVNGCLPEHQASFYTLCIADALAYMHTVHSIVYRDLKPENIMIDAQGYPKLIDMGYAKVLTPENDNKTFTFVGTPRYLAPETVESVGCSFGVDHWALGILAYEMLAGATPFYWEGLDETSLFQSIAEDEYPALPDTVSAEAVHLIAGLLTKDPRKRLGSRSESDILQHKWLQTLDLVALRRKQVQAPWVPDVSDALDASCFDDWDQLEDRVSQHYPTLMKKEAALFNSF